LLLELRLNLLALGRCRRARRSCAGLDTLDNMENPRLLAVMLKLGGIFIINSGLWPN